MKALAMILLGGLLFGFGLAMSTLVRPEAVLQFLHLEDFGLGLMMACALAVSMPLYQLAPRLWTAPLAGVSFHRFPTHVARTNIIGGALFGIGWGVSGVCPGAAIASLGVSNWPILFALAGMLIGTYLQGALAAPPAPASPGATPTPQGTGACG